MSEWINVQDRFPDCEGIVLVANSEMVRISYYVHDEEVWGSLDSAFWNDYVTHWMPLPEPPQ